MTANRVGDGAEPVRNLRDAVRTTVEDAQRAVGADQVAADADQSAADADQALSDADKSASNADQRSTSIDQLSSDRDQANADRQHAAGVELAPADELAYEASRDEREAVSVARQQNRVKRARTAGRRDATADRRDRTTETRGEGGRARDERVVVSQLAIDAWETLKRAEDQESRESEAKYRGLLEAAPDAMVVVNQAGEIVLLNLQVEKQFGYRRDELVGQPVTTIIPVGFAERLIADDLRSAAEALAQQIGTGIELSGRRKDGTEFPIEIMLSPLESADGILVTAAIRNISVRKLAEGQLLQAQKLESIGRLAGGIAHDFNNMLFVINGHAELLDQDLTSERRTELDPDMVLRTVRAIRETGERAATLTAQLLAFSRQQVISPQVLDLNAAIGGVEPMVRKLVGENIRLVLELGHDAGHIRADASQLDQILVNLVVNARDAMPAGGTVTIRTGWELVGELDGIDGFEVRPGPYARLIVSDTGVGMDRATQERVFEPFFTTKEPGKGTGLGLATAYGIVHQAGGHTRVDSAPGVGSTFRLYFPRVDAPEATEHPRVAATPAIGTGMVLVAEDEPAVRDMTTQMMSRAGYRVVGVASGAEAMANLARLEEPIDVLVTDVIMPHMSGIELADLVMDRYPEVGVVLLSGYTAETLNLERVTSRGAVFVAKPVTSVQLVLAVQQAQAMRGDPGPREATRMNHGTQGP